MNGTTIAFDHVSKSYPMYHHVVRGFKHFILNLPESIRSLNASRFEALHDISFEVKRGEAFGIIGRNGAGKSTALDLMAGVLKPTLGKVTVAGRVSPLLMLGAGFHTDLTGRENILLKGVLLGMLRSEVSAKMEAIIEFSELGPFIDEPVRVYSSGMLARLGFSIIASLDPEILLIDEVLAVGDIDFQKKCSSKLEEFKQNGVTLVFVSHALPEMQRLCDRVLWLEQRSIRMLGPAAEVCAAYGLSRPPAKPRPAA